MVLLQETSISFYVFIVGPSIRQARNSLRLYNIQYYCQHAFMYNT